MNWYSPSDPNELLVCPYDSVHTVPAKRFQYHIIKCRKNHPDKDFVTCPFNAKHVILRPDLRQHIARCPDRGEIEKYSHRASEQDSEGYYFKGDTSVPSYGNQHHFQSHEEDWDASDGDDEEQNAWDNQPSANGYYSNQPSLPSAQQHNIRDTLSLSPVEREEFKRKIRGQALTQSNQQPQQTHQPSSPTHRNAIFLQGLQVQQNMGHNTMGDNKPQETRDNEVQAMGHHNTMQAQQSTGHGSTIKPLQTWDNEVQAPGLGHNTVGNKNTVEHGNTVGTRNSVGHHNTMRNGNTWDNQGQSSGWDKNRMGYSTCESQRGTNVQKMYTSNAGTSLQHQVHASNDFDNQTSQKSLFSQHSKKAPWDMDDIRADYRYRNEQNYENTQQSSNVISDPSHDMAVSRTVSASGSGFSEPRVVSQGGPHGINNKMDNRKQSNPLRGVGRAKLVAEAKRTNFGMPSDIEDNTTSPPVGRGRGMLNQFNR